MDSNPSWHPRPTCGRCYLESHLCRPSRPCRAGRASLTRGGYSQAFPSVAIPTNTKLITKIRTGPIEADDGNAINLVLNADTILPDRIYLKRWKGPDKADSRHIKVKEEPERAKSYSIEISGKLCSDIADERCTAEKRNDLLGQEPTTEPVTSCLGVTVLSTQ